MNVKKILISFLLLPLILILAVPVFARSGCCSSHRGVRADGCGCNDGTPLSSTCAPYYTCSLGGNDNIPVQQTQQVIQPIYTPIPTKTVVMPTNTSIPALSPTIKPISVPTRIKKTVNKISKITSMPTPKKSFWRWLLGL